MWGDVVIGMLSALAQFVTAWLGWQVTIKPLGSHQTKKKTLYKFLFLIAGLLPELWSIRRSLVSGVLSAVSISTHHLSPFNCDSARAKTPVVQASRSLLNLPSVRARRMPYVFANRLHSLDCDVRAHPEFGII